MFNVLHISAHLGGGVGKVLSNVCDPSKNNCYRHTIILLEDPEQLQFVKKAEDNHIRVLIKPSKRIIATEIKQADIVQIEWWHHPIMCKFLYDFPKIPVRLIIWSHISGCSYPIIKKDLIQNCSRFIFTSPYSLENPYLKFGDVKFLESRTDVVYSSGGFNNVIEKKRTQDGKFNIGYVGTLNFCKLNPDFLDYCYKVNIPNVKFIMVGDTSTKEEILAKAEEKHIKEKFEFVGYINNIQDQLNRFDVFGYLLNTEHYGTTENALLEAMAAGVPPVVLNQCTEKYLVKNMETGIIVNDAEEYGKSMKYLYENIDERIRIGNNAREYVLSKFDLNNTIISLDKSYDRVMEKNKNEFSFKDMLGKEPSDWLLSCLNDEKQIFEKSIEYLKYGSYEEILENQQQILNCKQILKEKNKSSIQHFQRYFENDKSLKYWAEIINKNTI